jgi:hypothetical protein
LQEVPCRGTWETRDRTTYALDNTGKRLFKKKLRLSYNEEM